MAKVNVGDIVYMTERVQGHFLAPGDEGLVIEGTALEVRVVWKRTGRTYTVRREHVTTRPPAKGIRQGDRVSLRTGHYAVNGRKLGRREHKLPSKGHSGQVVEFTSDRALVNWDGYFETRWVDLGCITVAPTQDEIREVHKSLGYQRAEKG